MKKTLLFFLTLATLNSCAMENNQEELSEALAHIRLIKASRETLQDVFKKETEKLSRRDVQKAYYAAATIDHYSYYEKINTKQKNTVEKALKNIQNVYAVWDDTETLPTAKEISCIFLASKERYKKEFCKNKIHQDNEEEEEYFSTKIIFPKKETVRNNNPIFNPIYFKNIDFRD